MYITACRLFICKYIETQPALQTPVYAVMNSFLSQVSTLLYRHCLSTHCLLLNILPSKPNRNSKIMSFQGLCHVLSNVQSTWLSRKLKGLVQSKLQIPFLCFKNHSSKVALFQARLGWLIVKFLQDGLVTAFAKKLNNIFS